MMERKKMLRRLKRSACVGIWVQQRCGSEYDDHSDAGIDDASSQIFAKHNLE